MGPRGVHSHCSYTGAAGCATRGLLSHTGCVPTDNACGAQLFLPSSRAQARVSLQRETHQRFRIPPPEDVFAIGGGGLERGIGWIRGISISEKSVWAGREQ